MKKNSIDYAKWIFCLTVVVCACFINISSVHAENSESFSVVYYDDSMSCAYPLIIQVSGFGKVVCNHDVICNTEKGWLLKENESMTLQLLADKNAELKEITLNGKNIKDNIQDNKITVNSSGKKQLLSVEFSSEKDGRVLVCIDEKEMRNEHPEGNYYITGEISISEKEEGEIEKRIRGKETKLCVCLIGTYSNSKYKTLGYVPCENNEYIAVKRKKKHVKLITGIFSAVLIILVAFALLAGKNFLKQENKMGIDPNASDYTSELKRPENIGNSEIMVPGYGTFTIQKGSDTIDTILFNPEGNPCFFKFTLVEKDTNNILYESQLVPPGQGVSSIKLNKTFDEVGSYNMVLKFQSIDLKNTNISYNGSDEEVVLNVVES